MITYDSIVEDFKKSGLYKRHVLIPTKNRNKYLKIHLNQTGFHDKIFSILKKVEEEVGLKRTFSHNPVNGTVTFTLYNV